jgi:hypothetical protein
MFVPDHVEHFKEYFQGCQEAILEQFKRCVHETWKSFFWTALVLRSCSAFVEETIEKMLPAEILFLEQYERARRLMREVVDLPNRQADLFVRLGLQNNGRLSKAKRQLPEIGMLSDGQVAELEEVVREAFRTGGESVDNPALLRAISGQTILIGLVLFPTPA